MVPPVSRSGVSGGGKDSLSFQMLTYTAMAAASRMAVTAAVGM